MPQAPMLLVTGMQSNVPNKISATPLIRFKSLGAGRLGGIIFIYNRATLK